MENYTSEPVDLKGMEEKVYSLFSFAYSVSFLDPESSFREDLQSELKGGGTPTFLEAPGPKLACGVPTFLSCWGRRVGRLVGPMGTSEDAVLQSPCCSVRAPAPCPRPSPADLQSPRLEESLSRGGLGRFLWICSGPSLGPGSKKGHFYNQNSRSMRNTVMCPTQHVCTCGRGGAGQRLSSVWRADTGCTLMAGLWYSGLEVTML